MTVLHSRHNFCDRSGSNCEMPFFPVTPGVVLAQYYSVLPCTTCGKARGWWHKGIHSNTIDYF
jgi:hypothetical protein